MPPAGLPNATRPGPRGRPTAGPSDPLWSEEIVVGDGQKRAMDSCRVAGELEAVIAGAIGRHASSKCYSREVEQGT